MDPGSGKRPRQPALARLGRLPPVHPGFYSIVHQDAKVTTPRRLLPYYAALLVPSDPRASLTLTALGPDTNISTNRITTMLRAPSPLATASHLQPPASSLLILPFPPMSTPLSCYRPSDQHHLATSHARAQTVPSSRMNDPTTLLARYILHLSQAVMASLPQPILQFAPYSLVFYMLETLKILSGDETNHTYMQQRSGSFLSPRRGSLVRCSCPAPPSWSPRPVSLPNPHSLGPQHQHQH